MSSRFSPTGGSGNPALKYVGLVLVLGAIAALIAFAVLYNKKKPCKDFTCPDGKTNRVNSKGTSIEECCYTATPAGGTPGGTPGGGDQEPEEPEETITQGGKKKNVGMIVGAAIGGVLLLIIIGFAIFATIGRRSLEADKLNELREAAETRAKGYLGSSRIASLAPVASRSLYAGSLAGEGFRRAASKASTLFGTAREWAQSALSRTSPVAAEEDLLKAERTGAAAADAAGAASDAAAGLSSRQPQRSTRELLSAVDSASARLSAPPRRSDRRP